MLISFEGIEGSGKSTQCQWLYNYFLENNIPALLTKEPGGTAIGQQVRKILLNKKSNLAPLAELFLYMADRAQHVEQTIKPALTEGKIVLVDRYFDSTIAYQVFGRQLSHDMVNELNFMTINNYVPDITFLFDVEAEIGLARARSRNTEKNIEESEGRFEALELAFHQRVRQGYLNIAFVDPDARFRIIDANRNPEEIFDNVLTAIEEKRYYARCA